MAIVLLLTPDSELYSTVASYTASAGHTCLFVENVDQLEMILSRQFHVTVVDCESFPIESEVWELLISPAGVKSAPIILLTSERYMDEWQFNRHIDDFILKPIRMQELQFRIQRAIWKTSKMISQDSIVRGDLIIDTVSYEVMVRDRQVDLTYREYELLKYLASNPGRVISRDTLLDKVWGIDYIGGDRTVDVHIRRLRTKIEDGIHTFIDTVRNVGYRFRKQ